jgi:hypothetical protein
MKKIIVSTQIIHHSFICQLPRKLTIWPFRWLCYALFAELRVKKTCKTVTAQWAGVDEEFND